MTSIRNIAIALIAFLLLASCSPKVIYQTQYEYRDSVVTVVHERLVHSTASVEIPVVGEKNVTEADSSHLENEFAKSDAVIRNGKLYHSLETKPQTINVPVAIPVADTTTYHSSKEKGEITLPEVKMPVPAHLSTIQQMKLKSFNWLLLAALGLAGWTFRKPLLSILKNFIKL